MGRSEPLIARGEKKASLFQIGNLASQISVLILAVLFISLPLQSKIVADKRINVEHFGGKWLVDFSLYSIEGGKYNLKILATPSPLRLDLIEEGTAVPATVHILFDLGRAGEIKLATEDDVAYFSCSKNELRSKSVDLYAKMTGYGHKSGNDIYGDLRQYADYNLEGTVAEWLVGLIPVLGDAYSAYKVADAFWNILLSEPTPYWGVVFDDFWTQTNLHDLEKTGSTYKEYAPLSSPNPVFFDHRRLDFQTIRWKELFSGYAYELNYLFTMARTKDSSHHLYVRAVLPYKMVVIHTDKKNKKTIKKQYERFMEVEWKAPLKDGNEAPLIGKTPPAPEPVSESKASYQMEVKFEDRPDEDEPKPSTFLFSMFELRPTLYLPESLGDGWYRLHIPLRFSLRDPGSVQLAVRDDTAYFGETEFSYRKVDRPDSTTKSNDIVYPKECDPLMKKILELITALSDYTIGMLDPSPSNIASKAYGFLPVLMKLDDLKDYSYDWRLTTKTPYGSKEAPKGVFEYSDAAKSPHSVFSCNGDTVWDHETVAWEKLAQCLIPGTNPGYGREINYRFKLFREPDAKDDVELYIRAVLPYEHIEGADLDHYARWVRHLELEWKVQLPWGREVKPPEPEPTPQPTLYQYTLTSNGNNIAVDDDLHVYLNEKLIFKDDNHLADYSHRQHKAIVFSGSPGDKLRIVAIDYHRLGLFLEELHLLVEGKDIKLTDTIQKSGARGQPGYDPKYVDPTTKGPQTFFDQTFTLPDPKK